MNKELVHIINPVQAGLYIKHGVKPIDMYWDDESKKLIFMFSKKETKELFALWCDHKLN